MDTNMIVNLVERLADPSNTNAPLALRAAGFSSAETRLILAALAIARSSKLPQFEIISKILNIMNLRYWKKQVHPE